MIPTVAGESLTSRRLGYISYKKFASRWRAIGCRMWNRNRSLAVTMTAVLTIS
jgi:hypothetical protein